MKNYFNKLKTPLLLSCLLLLVSTIFFTGCMSRGATSAGWAGGVVKDNILYVGSMKGNLVSVNLDNGSIVQSLPLESTQASTGFLSCGQAATRMVIYGSPVIADGLVVIGGNGANSKIYAYTTEEVRYEPRWVYPRDESVSGVLIGSVLYDNGKLYFGTSGNKIFALDARDGFKEWEAEISDMIWSTPAISGDTLYVGSFNKKLIALSTVDGSVKWEFETEGAIVSTPVVDGTTVYIGSFDRTIYALNAATGTVKWQFKAGNWFWARPAVYGNVVFAPCLDGKVYVLDKVTGTKKAEYDLGSPISSSPVVIDDMLIVGTQEGELHAINEDDNGRGVVAVLEKGEKIYADLVAGDGKVYVHSSLDKVYEIDAKTGSKRELVINPES